MDRIPMTREGYDKLRAELERMETVEMIEITKRVAAAREMGEPDLLEKVNSWEENRFPVVMPGLTAKAQKANRRRLEDDAFLTMSRRFTCIAIDELRPDIKQAWFVEPPDPDVNKPWWKFWGS